MKLNETLTYVLVFLCKLLPLAQRLLQFQLEQNNEKFKRFCKPFRKLLLLLPPQSSFAYKAVKTLNYLIPPDTGGHVFGQRKQKPPRN